MYLNNNNTFYNLKYIDNKNGYIIPKFLFFTLIITNFKRISIKFILN